MADVPVGRAGKFLDVDGKDSCRDTAILQPEIDVTR